VKQAADSIYPNMALCKWYITLINYLIPSTGEVLASTVQGNQEDVNAAVAAANTAYQSWSKTPPHVRARHLYRSVSGIGEVCIAIFRSYEKVGW
jgi:acyl-CoA reductase-like NAD-dependent aldehyde dehydrogenase